MEMRGILNDWKSKSILIETAVVRAKNRSLKLKTLRNKSRSCRIKEISRLYLVLMKKNFMNRWDDQEIILLLSVNQVYNFKHTFSTFLNMQDVSSIFTSSTHSF